ncbi:MAG: thioesterase family protein [Anaerolineales bacterium]|nr:thioesterase family protein [Anaerolineales bacterium]
MTINPLPSRIAIIGTGVIGSGWAAHFLRNGMTVTAYDPAPDAETRLRQKIETVWPTLARIGLHPDARPDKLHFAPTLEAAVADAEFIQESVPERLPLKIATLTAIGAAAPPDSIIASSTSGYGMTEMAIHVRHPERCVVAHPFNPPYLMPVVEVVAGAQTSPEFHQRAVDIYRATGKQPLKLTKEIPGFVADRIMEAVWREILHMINNDMATVEEIDMSVRYGPGLRWAMMGPLTVLHLGGGEGGMAHLIHQFGPSLQSPWTFLEAPELTDELAQKVIDGCNRLTEGRPIHELEAERDDLLIRQIELLNQSRLWHLGNPHQNSQLPIANSQLTISPPPHPSTTGSAFPKPKSNPSAVRKTNAAQDAPNPQSPITNHQSPPSAFYDDTLFLQTTRPWQSGDPVEAPLRLYHTTVPHAWIDYNGHMTEAAYLAAFGYSSDEFFRFLGIDDAYRASGSSYYTVETHIHHLRECSEGAPLYVTTQILDYDTRRVHLFHTMHHGDTHERLATGEQMIVHVDMAASRSSPARPHVLEALAAIRETHQNLPTPKEVGKPMGIRKK